MTEYFDISWFFRNINKCKQIVGEDKIYPVLKKVDLTRQSNLLRLGRRNPFLLNIHLAEKQIFESDGHLSISDQIIKIGVLGYHLDILNKNKAIGLDYKIEALFTDKFEKIIYEIQVGALFAKNHYQIEFIKENALKKTPDIVVNFGEKKLEIECKKKDIMTSRDKQNESFWNRITNESNILMNQNKKNLVIILETKNDPNNSDFKPIIQEIKRSIEEIQNEIITIERKSFKIVLKQVEPFDQIVVTPAAAINLETAMEVLASSEDYYKLCGVSNSFIELDHQSIGQWVQDLGNGFMQQKNRRFFGFKSKIMPDRITSVIDSINKANKQLSGDNPGLIFVDQNIVDKNIAETDLKRLDHLIKSLLKNNSKISGVVITQIIQIRNPGNYRHRYLHGATLFLNEHPKHPVPEEIYKVLHMEH